MVDVMEFRPERLECQPKTGPNFPVECGILCRVSNKNENNN